MSRTTEKLERTQNKLNAKLITAAAAGYTEYALALMNKGADVNTQDKNGQTPLMVSIKGNHVKLTKIFLDEGAALTFKGPVHWTRGGATSHGSPEIAQALIAKKDLHGIYTCQDETAPLAALTVRPPSL